MVTVNPTREVRRVQLLDAADAVISREGPAASMASIAAEAGITKPILYRYFEDKGGLYRALAERHTATLLQAVGDALRTRGDLRSRTRRSIEAYLALVEANPETYRFLTSGEVASEPGVRSHVATTIDTLAGTLALGIAHELGQQPGIRAQVWARGIVGMVRSSADWWLADAPRITRRALAEELTALLYGAFPALAAAG